jgi:ABC-type transport system involved in Fe-S cluster assembly fused permease/ATPase subunit
MLSGQACDGNAAYSTIHNSNADRESITSSRSDFNASDDDSHSEDDDASIRKAQQERLASSSGWLDYLHPYKVFLPYLFPKKNRKLQLYFVIVLINILIQRALVILHPRQLGIIIDNLRQGGGSIPWKDIFVWFALEVASSQSCGVAAANELLENRLAAWSRQELTYASLEHVMGLSMSFHDAKDSGEVVKAIEQAESLNDLVRLLMTDLSPAVLDVTLSLIYVLLLFDIYATLIVIAMINGFVYATYKITLLATIARRISARKERDESKLVYESVGNWFTVAVFNQISLTLSKLSSVLTQRSKAGLRNDDLYTSIYFFQEGCEHLGRLAVTILAAHRIVQGRSSLGDLVALQSYWVTIAWPLYILGHNYRRISSSLVDAERLLQLFQVSPSITESPLATSLSHITGVVEFKDVSFAYEGRESTLSNINLSVSPGQTIALVGATGSGKSTLLKLLTRFHDPTIGSLTLDGHDLRAIKLNDLRDAFALVPQDPVLFNATLLENVRYGRPTASDHEVWDACKAASIHETILRLPKGYASTVGERGIKLSGGERQRIAIARALLRNSPIVLLDEATSAMDSATEGKIQDALAVLMKGRTSFVIAHRLSTVVGADVIVVMDKGKIVERGTHVELLEKEGGVYRELWKKQGGGCVLRDDADGKEQGEGSGEGGKKGL